MTASVFLLEHFYFLNLYHLTSRKQVTVGAKLLLYQMKAKSQAGLMKPIKKDIRKKTAFTAVYT